MWFPATVLAHLLLRLGNSSVYYIWHLCSLPYRVCVSLGGVNFFFYFANRKTEAQAESGEFEVRSSEARI